jgi:hypothetical protein
LWTPKVVEFIAPTIAITKESGASSFEMVDAQLAPFRGVFELHRHFGILVVNQFLFGIPAVHAHETIEHQF